MSDQKTVAYPRPMERTWRERTEAVITRISDAYDTLWDIMPAIAALATLLFLINAVSK